MTSIFFFAIKKSSNYLHLISNKLWNVTFSKLYNKIEHDLSKFESIYFNITTVKLQCIKTKWLSASLSLHFKKICFFKKANYMTCNLNMDVEGHSPTSVDAINNSDDLTCYCLGHCPDGRHNGTCVVRKGTKIFGLHFIFKKAHSF